MEDAAEGRACLYLYAAELAAVRGDEDAADDMESRAWELLEPCGLEMPNGHWGAAERYVWGESVRWRYSRPESFDPDRAAGPGEVREMLLYVRKMWSAEEDETLEILQTAKKSGRNAAALKVLRTRWSAAADAISALTADIARIDETRA